MTIWCNNCADATCMTDGCYDSCGMAEGLPVVAFIGIMIVVAIITGCLTTIILLVASKIHGSGVRYGELIVSRLVSFVFMCAGGVGQVMACYFALYDRHWKNVPRGTALLPPCDNSWVSFGTFAGPRSSVESYLVNCQSEKATVIGIRAAVIASLLGSVLMTTALFGVRSPIPAALAWLGIMVALSIATAFGNNLFTQPDFCGSGRSLEGLYFEKSDGMSGLYAALICYSVAAVGGVLQVLVLRFWGRNRADFTPLPAIDEGSVATGVPVNV